MSAYRWIGPVAKFEQPGSPDVSRVRDMETWWLTYEGPYNLLYASQPAWGSSLPGLPPDVKTGSCQVKRDVGNVATLTIRAARILTGVDPFYKRDREEIQKRIQQHPRYIATAGQPGHFYELTKEQMFWLDMALQDEQSKSPATSSPFWSTFAAKYPATTADTFYLAFVLGSVGLTECYNRIKEGNDSYVIGCPTIEEEKRFNSDPGGSNIYVQEAPPAASNYPFGYSWMRVKDFAAQAGDYPIWVRRRKWIGFDHIAPNTYD